MPIALCVTVGVALQLGIKDHTCNVYSYQSLGLLFFSLWKAIENIWADEHCAKVLL